MEDKRFQPSSARLEKEQVPPVGEELDLLMEQTLQALERSIEEGNRLLGFPPLPPMD